MIISSTFLTSSVSAQVVPHSCILPKAAWDSLAKANLKHAVRP